MVLSRKIWRDILGYKGQFIAVTVMIVLGVALFSASYLSFANLKTSAEESYERLNFADLTVYLAGAPDTLVERARRLPGVDKVLGRISRDVPMDLAGSERRLTARLVSLPGPKDDRVNDLHLVRGSRLDQNSIGETLILKEFAEFHELQPGDRVEPIIDGIRRELTVRGVVISPEYLYLLQDRQQMATSPRDFGVFFVTRATADEFFGTAGTIDQLAVTLQPGAREETVKEALQELCRGYGYRRIMERDQQPSYSALNMELQGLSELGVMFPALFLGVAAMIIVVLMARIVKRQRSEIGLLRALGYPRAQITRHYLSFGFLIGSTGAAVGLPVGYALSVAMTRVYAEFFSIPYLSSAVHPAVQVTGIALGVGSCTLAVLQAARRAARLTPAEAMRPEAPSAPGTGSPARIALLRQLKLLWKIPVRSIMRTPWRSVFTVLGIAVALSLLVVSGSFYDAFEVIIGRYFDKIIAYDARVNFTSPLSMNVVGEVEGWPEVARAEPVLELPVRFRLGGREYETILTGLPRDAEMYRLYEPGGNRVQVTTAGILLSTSVQREIGAVPGDTIVIEPLFPGLPATRVKVAGLVDLPVGSAGFLPLRDVQTLFRQNNAVTAVMVRTRAGGIDALRNRTSELSTVAGIEEAAAAREDIEKWLGLAYAFIGIMVLFGMALGGAIVYSITSINTMERLPELATLCLIGMDKRRVGGLLGRETLILAVPGLIFGVGIGRLLAGVFAASYSSDVMTLSAVVLPRTYLWSALAIMAAAVFALLPSIRRIYRINVAEAAKYRE
ncbi:MAG: ABC transporter permease [Peptococcaceae bacterium]|nr:ABC transporter permease [Peptococcaceae bacterium]